MGDRTGDDRLDPGFPRLGSRSRAISSQRHDLSTSGGVRWKSSSSRSRRPVGLRVAHLVGPDEESVDLAPVVRGRPRVTGDRRLEPEFLHRVDGSVTMYWWITETIGTSRPIISPSCGPVGAGRVDDVLGNDPTLLGDDLPAPVGQLVHVGHPVVADDLAPSWRAPFAIVLIAAVGSVHPSCGV